MDAYPFFPGLYIFLSYCPIFLGLRTFVTDYLRSPNSFCEVTHDRRSLAHPRCSATFCGPCARVGNSSTLVCLSPFTGDKSFYLPNCHSFDFLPPGPCVNSEKAMLSLFVTRSLFLGNPPLSFTFFPFLAIDRF